MESRATAREVHNRSKSISARHPIAIINLSRRGYQCERKKCRIRVFLRFRLRNVGDEDIRK